MKKAVCGVIIGAVISTGVQVSALGKRWYYISNETPLLNEIGEIVFELAKTQKDILSKLKSIDARLKIENEKGVN